MNDAIQSPDNQISETTPQENDGIKFSIAEYSALRDEILKRTEVQHQILLLTITALGAFLSNSSKAAITAILVFPILALFLAAAWAHSDIRIRQIGAYIRSQESQLSGIGRGWENYLHSTTPTARLGSLAFFASRGIFVGAQILSMCIALLNSNLSNQDVMLFAHVGK